MVVWVSALPVRLVRLVLGFRRYSRACATQHILAGLTWGNILVSF